MLKGCAGYCKNSSFYFEGFEKSFSRSYGETTDKFQKTMNPKQELKTEYPHLVNTTGKNA